MGTIEKNKQIIRAATYLRVSTKDQDENTQLPDIVNKIKADGAILNDEHIFRDKLSGLKNESEREGLNNLLQLTKDDIDIVYLWEISRLSRDYDVFDELMKKFKKKKINVCFLQPMPLYMFDFGTTNESPTTSIVLTIISRIALYELKEKSERTKRGKKEAINRGESYTSHAPYGYKKIDKKLAPDFSNISNIKGFKTPVEVVQSIFKLYNQGATMVEIADKLNTYNIPTLYKERVKKEVIIYAKSGVQVEVNKLQWVKFSVYTILKNSVYAGYKDIYNKIKIDDEQEKTITKRIATPAIIDEETFLFSIKKRKDNVSITDKTIKNEYLIRGLLKCENCERTFITTNKGYVTYYVCSDQFNTSRRTYTGCKNTAVNSQKLDSLVWQATKELYKEYALKQTQEKTKLDYSNETNQLDNEINSIETNIKRLENSRNSNLRRMAKNNISDNVFDALNDEVNNITNQINIFQSDIANLKLKKNELITNATKIDELQKMNYTDFDITSIENNFEAKKEAIRKIVDRITVTAITTSNNKKVILIKLYTYKVGLSNNLNISILMQPRTDKYSIDFFAGFDDTDKYSIKLHNNTILQSIEHPSYEWKNYLK
jgi:Site-specific recombinases, DNA invertase Pin homologs